MNETLAPSASMLGRISEACSRTWRSYTRTYTLTRSSHAGDPDRGLGGGALRTAGYEVTTGIGKTGVVGLLRNGEGPTVMLRADMDALPVEEATGVPYASKATAVDREGKTVPVMHACGHDMHVTWLVGATTLLAQTREAWRGTLMAVFQPAEETGQGAQAMIDDGLFRRFPKPDVVLGQHVMVGPAGASAVAPGSSLPLPIVCRSACSGAARTARCLRPSVDPVVMAAATVLRLQTSSPASWPDRGRRGHGRLAAGRHQGECDPRRGAHQAQRPHLRRGRAQAGARRDHADRERRGGSLGRPETTGDHAARSLSPGDNDWRLPSEWSRHSGDTSLPAASGKPAPTSASEDFGSFGAEWHTPSVFWFIGGTDPDIYAKAKAENRLNEIPTNHNPRFLPVLHPTLKTGVEALIVAARAWLSAANVTPTGPDVADTTRPCTDICTAGAGPRRHLRVRH